MAGIAGSHANSLAQPVPGAGEEQASMDAMGNVQMPAMPAQAAPAPEQAPAARPSLDQIFAAPAQRPSLDAIFGAPEAPAPNEPAPFMDRLAAGFAPDDERKAAYLRKKYGAENVAETSEGIKYKKNGKWNLFNADHLGIGDVANLGRTAAVEIGAAPAEIAGSTIGLGLGGPAGSVGGFAVARGVGGAMGESLARGIADSIGIPRKTDSVVKEVAGDALAYLEQGGMRAIFGHIADAGTQKLMGLGVKKVEDAATRAAIEAVDQASAPMRAQTEAALAKLKAPDVLTTLKPEKKALAGVQDAVELNEAAKRTGLNLRPDEMFPNQPKLQELADAAMASPKMQEEVMKRGQHAVEAIESISGSFDSKGSAQSAVEKGSVVDRAFGKLIGSHRESAIEAAGDKTMEMGNLQHSLSEARKILQFDGLKKPNASQGEDIANGLNIPLQKYQFLIERVGKLTDEIENGKQAMTPKRADELYKIFRGFADNHFDTQKMQSADFQVFKTIKNGLRDDFSNGIKQFLSEADQKAYEANMSRFSDIKSASKGVKQLLGTDSPSNAAIVEFLRNGGIKNADRIQNLKTLVAQEHPEEWNNIGKAFFDRVIADHRTEGAEGQRLGNVNWNKLVKTLDTDKKQFSQLQAIVGEERANKLVDLANVMSAAQRGDRDFVANPAWYMKAVKAIGAIAAGDPQTAANMLSADRASLKLLDSEKANQLISKLALKDRKSFQQVLSLALEKAAKPMALAPDLAAQQATRGINNAVNDPPQQ